MPFMSDKSLQIEELTGSRPGIRVLRLTGPILLTNLFDLQSKIRAETAPALILDFAGVPLVDSAGIGVMVGAYVSRQKDGRSLGLVGVNQRISQALEITQVHKFFRFFNSVEDAERATA